MAICLLPGMPGGPHELLTERARFVSSAPVALAIGLVPLATHRVF